MAQQHAEQRAQVGAVLAALARLAPEDKGVALKPNDLGTMAALLPLLWARWPNNQVFDSSEVRALAEVDTAVRGALGPLVRQGGSPGRRVGRLLARCAGASVAGLQLIVDRDHDPPLYVVRMVSNPAETPQTDPGP